jgi:GTPase SAR1 family protein
MKSGLREIVTANPSEWQAKGMEAVPREKGEAMKKAVNAQGYIECSAKMQINLKEVFEAAIKVVLHPPQQSTTSDTKDSDGHTCCEIF